MENGDLQSLNTGVFVMRKRRRRISTRPHRLGRIYGEVYDHLDDAYQAFETARSAEQVDEIADWLLSCSANCRNRGNGFQRLPVALMQDLSPAVRNSLSRVTGHPVSVDCRGAADVGAVTRAIAVELLGESVSDAQRSGKTPIEAVRVWWEGLSHRNPILVHLENPQLAPATVMSDLIYILSMYSDTPFRLLLSVPSVNAYLSTWTILEPSVIDLHVMGVRRYRKGVTSAGAVLEADHKSIAPGTQDDNDQVLFEEEVVGGGAPAALKSMKWLLLHRRHNSSHTATRLDEYGTLQTVINQRKPENADEARTVPGQDYGRLIWTDGANAASSTQNPAPRLSVLRAMSNPQSFVGGLKDDEVDFKFADQGRLRPNEIQSLYRLWQCSGKTVNLWDWLEGFRAEAVSDEVDVVADGTATATGEDTDDRLHATFIRFVEESRLFGTVRARGKGTNRRADEVVKGVVLI